MKAERGFKEKLLLTPLLNPRAIELVKSNENYNEQRCKAFVCDVTDPCAFMGDIPDSSLDLVSAIFVLSAIPPEKMKQVADNLKRVLKPGGKILFRDYGKSGLRECP